MDESQCDLGFSGPLPQKIFRGVLFPRTSASRKLVTDRRYVVGVKNLSMIKSLQKIRVKHDARTCHPALDSQMQSRADQANLPRADSNARGRVPLRSQPAKRSRSGGFCRKTEWKKHPEGQSQGYRRTVAALAQGSLSKVMLAAAFSTRLTVD